MTRCCTCIACIFGRIAKQFRLIITPHTNIPGSICILEAKHKWNMQLPSFRFGFCYLKPFCLFLSKHFKKEKDRKNGGPDNRYRWCSYVIPNNLCFDYFKYFNFINVVALDLQIKWLNPNYKLALPVKNIKVINSFYKVMHDMQRCLRL